MTEQSVRPATSFDKAFAEAQLASLALEGACAGVAALWLQAASADEIPTFDAFNKAGGEALAASLMVYEFGRSARLVAMGANFLRAAGARSLTELASVGVSDAGWSERLRKAQLVATGHAIRNVRQVRLAGAVRATIEEIALPLANAEGAMILVFADFGAHAGIRFENPKRDSDLPAYSRVVDLFRRPQAVVGKQADPE